MSGDTPCRSCGSPPVTLEVQVPAHLSHTGVERAVMKPVDACIADQVAALNAKGRLTAGACCGHGEGAGSIVFHDGSEIRVCSVRLSEFGTRWMSSLSTADAPPDLVTEINACREFVARWDAEDVAPEPDTITVNREDYRKIVELAAAAKDFVEVLTAAGLSVPSEGGER